MNSGDHPEPQTKHATVAAGRGRFRPAFPILLLVSLALLVLSRLEHRLIDQVRWQITEFMTPVLNTVLVPFEPMQWMKQQAKDHWQMRKRVARLAEENVRLLSWEWRALELQRKVDQLSGLARVVAEFDYKFVTARVMANSSGAFVRSVLINAGRQQRIRPGYPVVNGEGLVGRIVDAGTSAARVLLLTDLNSRVPVRVGAKGIRAILMGDNGASLKLDYLPADVRVSPGDVVATSGAGGVFPAGLKVGEVIMERQGQRVRPAARLDQLDYLSVLFYTSPRLEITDRSASRKDAQLVGQQRFKRQPAAETGARAQ